MTENLMLYGQIALAVIGAAVVALNVIAPLTKTETDNKILNALRWVQAKLALLVPSSMRK